MAKKVSLLFDGVKVSEGFMTGTIASKDLIDNFVPSWIPAYQRDRVQNRKKINKLIDIFRNNRRIDSIKLNLTGDYIAEKGKALIEGSISVIDGQQRLLALLDSEVRDIRIPVELYLNASPEEEIELFHQFNKMQTKLTFGELAKSTQGSFGKYVQQRIKKDDLPVPLRVNSSRFGVSLAVLCPVLNLVHRKRYEGIILSKYNSGKPVLKFLEDTYTVPQVTLVDMIVRQMFESFVEIFGQFDAKADAYRRGFILAWMKLVNTHFVESAGLVNFGKFKPRMRDMPTKLMKNASFKETLAGNSEAIFDVQLLMTEYLNYKLKTGHLPLPKRKVFSEDELVAEAEDGVQD